MVVKLKDSGIQIGLIALIKREYLPSKDFGLAFLDGFFGNGYAYEASSAMLEHFMSEAADKKKLLAITLPENTSSIKLLNRLGFHYARVTEVKGELLHVYQKGLSPSG